MAGTRRQRKPNVIPYFAVYRAAEDRACGDSRMAGVQIGRTAGWEMCYTQDHAMAMERLSADIRQVGKRFFG
jgi:hypothetical protein